MRSIPARSWLLVVFSAVLQVFCFPLAGPLPAWRGALGWFALAPLLYGLLAGNRESKPLTVLQGATLGYLCGILWYLGNCSWIYQTMYLYGGMEKPVALAILVLFSSYLGLYHALFGALVSLLGRLLARRMVLTLIPFCWVAVELARARVTGFPWDLLGYSQVDNLLLTRLAPAAGVMGLSFVLMAVNSVFCAGLLERGRAGLTTLGLGVLLTVGMQSGSFLPSLAPPVPATHLAVMVQENLSVGALARGERSLGLQEELQDFSALSLRPQLPVDGGVAGRPAVILWPEAPSHLLSYDSAFREVMRSLAQTAHAPLIIGSLGVDFDPHSASGRSVYDSAVVFTSAGDLLGRYDKIHLVPWGEYIPYKQFFAFAQKLTEGAGDMDRGSQRSVFALDGHRFGTFVCYESIFGDEVREFVSNGAEVLVNISDDGWYGDTGAPWQHLNMARMRAIENRRWILRDTNTGETTAIDPYGRYTATARHVRTAYGLSFDFVSGVTFYTRHGDWFAWLCVLVSAAGVAYSRPHRSTQPIV